MSVNYMSCLHHDKMASTGSVIFFIIISPLKFSIMKTFNSAASRSYMSGEHLEFLNYVLNVYNEADPSALKLKSRVDDLADAVKAFDEVFQNPVGLDNTKGEETLDEERLDTLSALRLYLLSFTKRRDAEKANMANQLLDAYKLNCDKIKSRSLPLKTAKIKAFIKDVTTIPALMEAVEKLNLAGEISSLDNSNIEFVRVHQENARSKKDPSTMPEKRLAAKAAYDLLLRDTQSYAHISEDTKSYEFIITEINKIIDRYNTSVKMRRSMRKKSKNASPPPQQTGSFENTTSEDM